MKLVIAESSLLGVMMLWLTNIGINGSLTAKGILEIINGISSSNIMSKWTEVNGDYF